MKKILLIAFLAILSTTVAYAEGGHGGGHGGGGRGGGHGGGWGRGGGWGWGGGWIGPALIGGAFAYDLAYPYPYYAQPYPVYDQPYPGYAPGVAPSSVQYWYFCPAAKAYYPYVQSCPGGWQAIPAMPPR
jgi:hypothetical protein